MKMYSPAPFVYRSCSRLSNPLAVIPFACVVLKIWPFTVSHVAYVTPTFPLMISKTLILSRSYWMTIWNEEISRKEKITKKGNKNWRENNVIGESNKYKKEIFWIFGAKKIYVGKAVQSSKKWKVGYLLSAPKKDSTRSKSIVILDALLPINTSQKKRSSLRLHPFRSDQCNWCQALVFSLCEWGWRIGLRFSECLCF